MIKKKVLKTRDKKLSASWDRQADIVPYWGIKGTGGRTWWLYILSKGMPYASLDERIVVCKKSRSRLKIFFVTSTTKSSIKVKILIWSTWFIQQMVTFYASFWQVLLQSSNFFFFTFMKHFLQLYKTKIQIFAITSTTKSSIKVKMLIWSPWFYLQMGTNVHILCILCQGLLQSSKFFLVLLRTKIHNFIRNINH